MRAALASVSEELQACLIRAPISANAMKSGAQAEEGLIGQPLGDGELLITRPDEVKGRLHAITSLSLGVTPKCQTKCAYADLQFRRYRIVVEALGAEAACFIHASQSLGSWTGGGLSWRCLLLVAEPSVGQQNLLGPCPGVVLERVKAVP